MPKRGETRYFFTDLNSCIILVRIARKNYFLKYIARYIKIKQINAYILLFTTVTLRRGVGVGV